MRGRQLWDVIYNEIIQLLIYDLQAQLKPRPEPPKITHYIVQLRWCMGIPIRSEPHQRAPNNRGKLYTDLEHKERSWQWQLVKLVVLSIAPFSGISLESLRL